MVRGVGWDDLAPRLAVQAAELAALARSEVTMREYHSRVIAACRALVPCDSAVVSEPQQPDGLTTSDVDATARQLIDFCESNYATFAPDLSRGLNQGARVGGFVDCEVYSLHERFELGIFCEVLRPQGIRSAVVLTPRWRKRPLGNIRLQRHGGTPVSQADLERLLPLLPAIELGLVLLRSDRGYWRQPDLDALTSREREIALYVGRGLTTPQIGLLLGTSRNTVRNQMGRIFDKLGVSSRAELAGWLNARAHDKSVRDPDAEESGTRQAARCLGTREAEVARHVARGLTTRQIALILGTSPLTVRNQIRRIFDKLGVAKRAELAARIGMEAPAFSHADSISRSPRGSV